MQPSTEARRAPAAAPAFPITPRAILVGAGFVALIAAINPSTAFESRLWNAGVGSLLVGAIFPLFLLVALNSLLTRYAPRLAFTRGELLVVYGMLTVTVGFLIWGGLPFLLSSTTFPFYMASPGNGWEHRVWPHIPLWLRVSSPEAVNWYWEGLPDGTAAPLRDWLSPMLAWSTFILALMTSMFCLGSLLRKDWIERQRLTFPLVEVPLALTGDSDRPSLRTSILGNRVFWLGFAIPATLSVLTFLHRISPAVPVVNLWGIPVGQYCSGMGLPWNVLSDVVVTIIFPVIGVICLLPGEVALSLWLFYLLFRVQLLLWASFGVVEGGSAAINPRLFISFEEAGAFFAFTGFALYQSRNTLRKAWGSLLGRVREEPDPYSPLSGRAAVLGFLAANLFLVGFAVRFGAKAWPFVAIMAVYYAILVCASRLVSAAGVMSTDTGFYPRWVVGRMFGTAGMGEPALVLFAYLSSIFFFEPDNLAMPQMLQSFKLLHAGKVRAKAFPAIAAGAMALLLAIGIPAMLQMIYRHGANGLGNWPFTSDSSWGFNEMDAALRTPAAPDPWMRLALLLGAGAMLGLTLLHTTFLWWPVSPIGFLIASSWGTNYKLWTNALLAWLISTTIRRYGGLRLYRTFRPAFLGLILGQYLTDGVLAVVSGLFHLQQPLG